MSITNPGADVFRNLISDHLTPKAQSTINNLSRNEFSWANVAELECFTSTSY